MSTIMRRFILDDDGTNFTKGLGEDVAGAVAETVRECPPEVTTYMVCSAAGQCLWPTRVGLVSPKYPGLIAAHQRGLDPLGMRLTALKEAGKETFITFRMNDVHNPTEADGWNTPRIRRDNPDCIVGMDEVQAGKAGWMSYCLDYTRQDVRDYVLALIEEQIHRYGDTIDGLQLDWMRFPRHLSGTPDEVWQKRGIMTQFMTDVRHLLSTAKKPILLCARVPTTLAGCRHIGMDIEAWARHRLVDMLIVCPFLTTDWQLPINEFRDLLGGAAIPVYAGFDIGFGPQVHFPESLRGICTSLYECNPDGLYLFNIPCWIERLAARPYHWLTGLENATTAAAKPLLFAVNHKRSRVAGVDQPAVTPADIAPGASVIIPVHLPAAALPTWRAICLVDSGGDLTLEVNGSPAPMYPEPYRSEIFIEFVNHYRPKTLRSLPENCRHFRVDAASLRPGTNDFTFSNPTGDMRLLDRLNLALW